MDKAASLTLSSGDLVATDSGGSDYDAVRATLGKTSGKHYFEVTRGSTGNVSIGVATSAHTLSSGTSYIGGQAASWGFYSQGHFYNNGASAGNPLGGYGSGAVISVALDLDAGKLWFAENGVWSGDPAAGTDPAFSGITGTIFPAFSADAGASGTANFGASAFSYTPPSGFSEGWFG